MTTTDYIQEKIQEFREKFYFMIPSKKQKKSGEVGYISPNTHELIESFLSKVLEQQREEIDFEVKNRMLTIKWLWNKEKSDTERLLMVQQQMNYILTSLSPQEDLPDIHPNACECRVCKGGQDE